MKVYIKVVLVLTIVSLVSGGLLSLADKCFRQKIADNQTKAVTDGILAIESKTAKTEKIEENLYKIFDQNDDLIGYAVLTKGQGYQGPIKILYCVDKDSTKLLGIEIIDSTETPGLGAKIKDKDFRDQLKDLSIEREITYTKAKIETAGQIKAITGATISSKAVVNIINNSIKKIKEKLQ